MLNVPIDRIVPLTDARDNFSKIVADIESQSDGMYVLTKGGKPAIALINIEFLNTLIADNNRLSGRISPIMNGQGATVALPQGQGDPERSRGVAPMPTPPSHPPKPPVSAVKAQPAEPPIAASAPSSPEPPTLKVESPANINPSWTGASPWPLPSTPPLPPPRQQPPVNNPPKLASIAAISSNPSSPAAPPTNTVPVNKPLAPPLPPPAAIPPVNNLPPPPTNDTKIPFSEPSQTVLEPGEAPPPPNLSTDRTTPALQSANAQPASSPNHLDKPVQDIEI